MVAGVKGQHAARGQTVIAVELRRALTGRVGAHARPAEHQIVQEDIVFDPRLLERAVAVLDLFRGVGVAVGIAQEHDGIRQIRGVGVLRQVAVGQRLVVAARPEDHAARLGPRVLRHVDQPKADPIERPAAEVLARVFAGPDRLVRARGHGRHAREAAIPDGLAVPVVAELVPERDRLVHAAGVGSLESLFILRLKRLLDLLRRARIIPELLEQSDPLAETAALEHLSGTPEIAFQRASCRVLKVAQRKKGVPRFQILPRIEQLLRLTQARPLLQQLELRLAVGRLGSQAEGLIGGPRRNVVAGRVQGLRLPERVLICLLPLPRHAKADADARQQGEHQHEQGYFQGFRHVVPPKSSLGVRVRTPVCQPNRKRLKKQAGDRELFSPGRVLRSSNKDKGVQIMDDLRYNPSALLLVGLLIAVIDVLV